MAKVGEVVNVESDFIVSIERKASERIKVNFKSGTDRTYRRISDKKFNALVTADSVGAFFNYAIRDNPRHADIY
jgi:hypothetical protein